MTPAAPVRAYVAFGGNEGDVQANLLAAIDALAALPGTSVQRRSSLYRTPAWGRTDQPDFLNGVVELHTALDAHELMQALLAVETRFGRVRGEGAERWGPRTVDLDLLAYGDEVRDEPGLTLPHPRLHERAFVLVPLAEIAPGLVVPGRGRVADLLAAVDATGIEAIP
ncbi:2-amino-4-hydroxy-6-hydroxymethyldihydropteridine diphosphokinase [bacterium BD-1]|uniref:2-amino-4-hydroxy-6- hydroxymethyldihydropteridine diphosphokinase n=1 Tax=Arenimonas sp. TaxID=1872635 RepID=UPI001E49D724|nr:2-amino-4-hydroxy-6-hydroxymethyldihydropteridine diphosphokinase [Ottowia caeni]